MLLSSCSKKTPGFWVVSALGEVSTDTLVLLPTQSSSLHEITLQHIMSLEGADKVVGPTEMVETFIQAKAT